LLVAAQCRDIDTVCLFTVLHGMLPTLTIRACRPGHCRDNAI
jgi:hypothetical protein